MNNSNYFGIDLFAGAGGFSYGLSKSGFNMKIGIESNIHASKTLKENNPNMLVINQDIRDTDPLYLLKKAKIKKNDIGIIAGGPPCQGFSYSNKKSRYLTNPLNNLYLEFFRYIKEIMPKSFIIENVSGMIKGKMKGLFINYMKRMKSLNYQVKCKLINAKYYNVPQSRQRVIFIGARKDLGIEPSYPEGNKKLITVNNNQNND